MSDWNNHGGDEEGAPSAAATDTYATASAAAPTDEQEGLGTDSAAAASAGPEGDGLTAAQRAAVKSVERVQEQLKKAKDRARAEDLKAEERALRPLVRQMRKYAKANGVTFARVAEDLIGALGGAKK